MTRRRLATALFFLAIAALCVAGYRSPRHNWDLLGYAGVAASWDTTDAAAIHARVYGLARAGLPPGTFAELTSDPRDRADRAYRQAMYLDPQRFVQQLPYYRVRPLYVGLLYALDHAGLGFLRAMVLVSVAAYAGLAAIVLAWLRRHLPLPWAALAALLLALSPPMLEALRNSASPDPLSAFVLLLGLYLLLERRHAPAGAWVILAAVFVRSDNAILTVMLFAALAAVPPAGLSRARLAWFTLGAVASYFAISTAAGHYGWSVLFQHTFVELLTDPARRAVVVGPGQYLHTLVSGLRSVFDSSAIVFALLGVLACALPARPAGALYDRVLLVLAANVAVRYALFPVFRDRFLLAYYLAAALILAAKASRYVPAARGRRAPGVASLERGD